MSTPTRQCLDGDEALRSCSHKRMLLRWPGDPYMHHLTGKAGAAPGALVHSNTSSAGLCQLCCAVPRPGESLPAWLGAWAALQTIRVTPGFACDSGSPCLDAPALETAGLCCQATAEAPSAQVDGSIQPEGAGGRDSDPPALPQIPLLPPLIPY